MSHDYTMHRGLLWPRADLDCRAVVFSECEEKMPVIRKHVTRRRSVVQAGGNCGVMPRALAADFRRVYTFEPDANNFHCLAVNTSGRSNVWSYRAALSDDGEHVAMTGHLSNCGALQTRPFKGDNTPSLCIDALNLDECDLIWLDIEGREFRALLGAEKTITICKPLVLIEEKGLEADHGLPLGASADLLRAWGMQLVERIGRDNLYRFP